MNNRVNCRIILIKPEILFLSVFLIFGQISTTLAVQFDLSGTLQHISTGETQPVTGTLNVHGSPSVFELDAGSGLYTVDHSIDYTLNFNSDTFTGSGTMRIRDTAGLFDNQFFNLLTGSSSSYYWVGGDATFYYADNTPYPEWSVDSLAYTTIPHRIEFQYGSLENTGSIPQYWITELVAQRQACWLCEMVKEYITDCFPWCPWPWVIASIIVIIVIAIRFRFRGNR